jgi:beta-lactamase superfamily II metal-dependent hydrolase
LMEGMKTTALTAGEILKKIKETLDPSTETLDHVHKNTSPENNSSVVAYFNIADRHLLFTGDAGIDALHHAADYAVSNGVDLTNLDFFDVPHHGSKHNLDGAFLDRIKASTAFISVTEQSEKHPSPRVINALVRRGFRVFTTEAGNIRHPHQAPSRDGYAVIDPYKFVAEFDDDA